MSRRAKQLSRRFRTGLGASTHVGFPGRTRRRAGSLVVLGRCRFTRGADVLRPGVGEDLLGPGDFLGILGVYRDENVPSLNLSFVPLGFELRNSQTD